MTFKEALQSEIDLQGLSVAQIAKDASLSKGAIYNILNGTTEDSRIRPATRRALAAACNREVRPDGDGVVFVEIGQESTPAQTGPQTESIILSWQPERVFHSDRHASAAFDWLYSLERDGVIEGLGVVDRVYQNRSDFLSLTLHNRGTAPVASLDLEFALAYQEPQLDHAFSAHVSEACEPGQSLELTAFVCAGGAFELSVASARGATDAGEPFSPKLPGPYSFPGGTVD